jgi:HK97 family phage major capsid protein
VAAGLPLPTDVDYYKGGFVMTALTKEQRAAKLAEVDKILDAVKASDEGRSVAPTVETRGGALVTDEVHERAFERYMRFGEKSPELRSTYGSAQGEAGFQSSGTSGGYLVPQGFLDRLQIAMKAYGGFGQYYQQVVTPAGNQMDWPVVNAA